MASPPEINPYAPPAAALDAGAAGSAATAEGRLDGPLFSAAQIGWGTFFGTLLTGVFMLQANFRVMKQPAAANKALLLGLLTTIAQVALIYTVPKGVPTPIAIGASWGIYKLAGSLQGDAFFRHTIAGGARRSGWSVVAILLVAFATVFAVGFVIGLGKHFARVQGGA